MSSPVKRNRRRYLAFTLLILLLGIATVAAVPWLKRCYGRWDAKNRLRRAEQSLAGKDYQRAALTVRSVLATDPVNADAIRLIARVLDATGSRESVQWWSRLDSLQPGNNENIIRWAASAMNAGDATTAEHVLDMLDLAAWENAECHAITARILQAKKDTDAAARHWAEAIRLEPEEPRHRLALGAIRLRSQDSKDREEAISMLTELTEKTPPSLEAVRLLLSYALRLEDWKRADELSKVLVSDSAAPFADKLQRLAALRKMDTQEAPGYLVGLRTDAMSNPGDLYLLLMWMNQHDLGMMVSEWSRTLPKNVIGEPPVCVAVADAFLRGSEWQRLREFLEDGSWPESDYLRRIFLARALERLGDETESVQEWKDGVAAARGRGDARGCLERMARLAIDWGWDQRAQEVMWSLAGSPGCPRWMLDVLWQIAIGRSDTAQLQKLALVFVQRDPKSVALRNSHAFFSLLVRSEVGDAHRAAERLHQENPGDAAIVVTRALSLYQQGKVAEAVELTGSLPAEELEKPQVALYHAIFLTAAGQSAKAAEFLPIAQRRKMFSEEKAMLERARLAVAKAAEESDLAEASKVAGAARAARNLEASNAVEAARAARAAQAAQESPQPAPVVEK